LIEAPTGSGKTLGNLFPALMAMAADNSDRLYFLTSRNTGREAALSALNLVFSKNQATALRVLVHCSKDDACEHPDLACNGDSCPLARGFYDRLPQAREAAINVTTHKVATNKVATSEFPEYSTILTPQQVREIALEHRLCPYYLSQELTRWCDLVIADINYYFDQHALLHALRQQQNWRVTLLVDEAHNVIDRARTMYSGQLSRALLARVRKTCHPSIKSSLERLNYAWRKLLKPYSEQLLEKEAILLDEVPGELNNTLKNAVSRISDYLADQGGDRDLQDLLFECTAFLNLVETFDSHSICRLSIPGTQNSPRGAMAAAQLGIRNLIPAPFLRPRFEHCEAAVLFSATLNPFHYYRDLLGLPDDCLELQVESPFESSQLAVRIAAGISTKLEDRARSVAPTVERICRQFRLKPANYIVYVSSFTYLKALNEGLGKLAPDLPLITQEPKMDSRTRQLFIDQFQENGRKIGLAVLGGSFAEGIDLPGTRLEGVFILTLGLPPHDEIHEVLRQRLDALFGNGYNYAYLYPGMRKVVQAAGRVIRTPDDTGVIELIDQRFQSARTKALLPAWWPAAKVEF
jgi:DNA excision repair protein ERCC-2